MDVIILDMGDEIKGESSVRGYENKMELLSFSHGAQRGSPATSAARGELPANPITRI